MAFPTSPIDGEIYTTSPGTTYKYVAADDKWTIVSQTMTGMTGMQGVTGHQGDTGVQGVTGLGFIGTDGVTGLQGVTGVAGTAGTAGAQGETGLIGATGAGLQGVTGLAGTNGSSGATGVQGVTGAAGTGGGASYSFYDAGTFGTTGANMDFANGANQKITIGAGGETGLFFVKGAATGMHGLIEVNYTRNVVPRGYTGIKWANATAPVLSGATGIIDAVHIFFDGTQYLGQASMGYGY